MAFCSIDLHRVGWGGHELELRGQARLPGRFGGWMKPRACLGTGLLAGLVACGGPGSYAEREEFRGDARFRRDFAVAPEALCAGARSVLLGEGYVLDSPAANAWIGAKEFQIEKKRHAVLQVHVACEPRRGGAVLFVTATEAHFDVGVRSQRKSFGLPLVAPITVVSKSEAGEQVKMRGETVSEKDFYERFYRAVKKRLKL